MNKYRVTRSEANWGSQMVKQSGLIKGIFYAYISYRRAFYRRASPIDRLIGVSLIGGHLIGASLTGGSLISVFLTRAIS